MKINPPNIDTVDKAIIAIAYSGAGYGLGLITALLFPSLFLTPTGG